MHTVPPAVKKASKILLGIDVGTSGIRACIVLREQEDERVFCFESVPMPSPIRSDHLKSMTQSPSIWLTALNQLFHKLSLKINLAWVTHIILDATSSTVLLCDAQGQPITDALMYNDQQASLQAATIKRFTPLEAKTAASGASSTLAKAMFLETQLVKSSNAALLIKGIKPIICHQIDFFIHALCGSLNMTDENNALKLGYDSINDCWPSWVSGLLAQHHPLLTLPKVVKPGTPLSTITQSIQSKFGFSKTALVHAGTTDSIAGFLASGASKLGDATTSLGSTLAFKMLSKQPIFSVKHGLYSHKLKNNWLVGGASNAGGAVLKHAYSISSMIRIIAQCQSLNLPVSTVENKKYYPLAQPGERFPIANTLFEGIMPEAPPNTLKPENSTDHQRYFLDIIQGFINVEVMAYQALSQQTGYSISTLYSVGGGLKNPIWVQARQEQLADALSVNVIIAAHSDAAYGVTKLIE